MNGFAFRQPKTITLPVEQHTVVVKKIGWKALEAAAMERQRQGIDTMKRIGPGGLLAEIHAKGGEDAVRAAAAADPFLQYDPATLLERGIVSWSISNSPNAQEIAELDPEDAEFAAREIYNMSRPRTKEEQKNG